MSVDVFRNVAPDGWGPLLGRAYSSGPAADYAVTAAWDGNGVDPWLPERLASEADITLAERRMYDSWWGSFSRWMTLAHRGVFAEDRPDPYAIFAVEPAWAVEMSAFVAGPVTQTVGLAFERLFGEEYLFDARPMVTSYLAQVFNRMVRTPGEVFDLVAGEVAKGAGAGESIPKIAARVDKILNTTGNENWRGRATTVARTETIGALNSGRTAAFHDVAEMTGDKYEQMWLATIDRRVRPDHAHADGQRVPLGQPFLVGGWPLAFPGDPAGPAEEVINCRCTTLLVKPGEDVDMSNRGWSDWEDTADQDLVAAATPPGGPVHGTDKLAQVRDNAGPLSSTMTAEDRFDARLAEVGKKQGFDALPQVGTATQLDAAVRNGWTEMWRGIGGGHTGPEAGRLAEQFRSGAYQPGHGLYGSGYYTSTSRATAEMYRGATLHWDANYRPTGWNNDGSPGGMLRMALNPNARVLDFDIAMHDEIKDQLERWERQGLLTPEAASLLRDPGRYAAALGYDVIRVHGYTDGVYIDDYPVQYAVLNRSAVMVQRAEDLL